MKSTVATRTVIGFMAGVSLLTAVPATAFAASAGTEAQAEKPDYRAIREQNRFDWIYREMNEGWGEPEEVTPTQEAKKDYKAIREQNRFDWIYREMNEGWGEPEEVAEAVPPAQLNTPETKAPEKSSGKKKRSMTTDDIPHYGEIKRYYFEKGACAAFTLFIYYHPTPFGYEVVEHIEKEIKEGNRGYTIDGVYYEGPEQDPYFIGKDVQFR